jgi:hypothetical protein
MSRGVLRRLDRGPYRHTELRALRDHFESGPNSGVLHDRSWQRNWCLDGHRGYWWPRDRRRRHTSRMARLRILSLRPWPCKVSERGGARYQ